MNFHRGDIIKVNLNPIRGHEQGNYRPAVVINEVRLPNVYIILPITSHKKGFIFEVDLDSRTKTHGVILPFQIRSIDLNTRNAEFVERLPNDILETCTDYIIRIVSELD